MCCNQPRRNEEEQKDELLGTMLQELMHSSQEMWHLLCVVVAEELGATDEERTDEVVVGKHQNDVIDKKHMWHLLSSWKTTCSTSS